MNIIVVTTARIRQKGFWDVNEYNSLGNHEQFTFLSGFCLTVLFSKFIPEIENSCNGAILKFYSILLKNISKANESLQRSPDTKLYTNTFNNDSITIYIGMVWYSRV